MKVETFSIKNSSDQEVRFHFTDDNSPTNFNIPSNFNIDMIQRDVFFF